MKDSNRIVAALLSALAIAPLSLAWAQVPKLLLRSLNEGFPGASWDVRSLTRVGSRLVFTDQYKGSLYAVDPSSGRTSLVLNPAESSPGSFDGELLGGGDEDLFAHYPESIEARPLAATDGTLSGSRMLLATAFPGVQFGPPVSLAPERRIGNRHLFLSAFEAGVLQSVWASDATPEGTFRISTPHPAFEAVLCDLTPMAGGYLLPVGKVDGTTELWFSDGTPAGSHLAATVPYRFREGTAFVLDGRGLYVCEVGPTQRGLCSTDGTANGTAFLDVQLTSDFLGKGNLAYFEGLHNGVRKLWRSDGTTAGTFALDAPGTPDVPWSPADHSAGVPGGLVLRTDSDSGSIQIWMVSADGASAERLATACDAVGDTTCAELPAQQVWQLDGKALFFAEDSEHGVALWGTDGTPTGTLPLLEMPGVKVHRFTIEEDGRWYALGESTVTGEELYVSDGTPEGSLRLTDFDQFRAFSQGGVYAPEIAIVDDRVWFAASEAQRGSQLYSADPRLAGAFQETHWRRPGPAWSVTAGGRPGLFGLDRPCAYDPSDDGLWSSDGTPRHTELRLAAPSAHCSGFPISSTGVPYAWGSGLAVPWRGTANRFQLFWLAYPTLDPLPITSFADGDVHNATQLGAASVYQIRRQDGSWELWASDSPESPPRFLADLPASTEIATRPQPLSTLALFASSNPQGECEVTRTDGTAAGTYALGFAAAQLLCPDRYSFSLTQVGNRGFFIMIDADLHGTIWETDGSVANTRPFSPPELGVLWFLQPAHLGGRIVFAADEDGQPPGLYAQPVDSNVALRLTDLAPLPPFGSGYYPPLAAATSSRIFISAFEADHGRELWSADALGGPFTLLRDIAPGARSSHPQHLSIVDDQLLFSATDDVHGYELWLTDGTSAGTRMIWEVAEGGASSAPSNLTTIGTDLIFSAQHPVVGRGAWILHLGPETKGLIFDDDFESGSTAEWEPWP